MSLLEDVGQPARDARHRENGCEESGRYSEQPIHGAGEEVDVGIDRLSLLLHAIAKCLLYRLEYVVVAGVTLLLRKLLEVVFHHDGTRILGAIHAMAHTHHLSFLIERLVYPFLRLFGRPDLVGHVHDFLVRSAVEASPEGPDGGRDARVARGDCRCDHARGEGGGVEAVLGVEDERFVHDLALELGRLLAAHHVEEVCTVGEIHPRRDVLLTVTEAMQRGHDGRELYNLMQGRPAVAVGIVLDLVIDVAAEIGDRRLQKLHRMGVMRELTDHLENRILEMPALAHPVRKAIELVVIRELAVEEQIDHFLERAVVDQFPDRISEVVQLPVLAVDATDVRLGGNDALETL